MGAPVAPLLGQLVQTSVRRDALRHVTPRTRRVVRHREAQQVRAYVARECTALGVRTR